MIKFKQEEETLSIQKLIQNTQAIYQKMDKLEKKIESQDNAEYGKLKTNLKNN